MNLKNYRIFRDASIQFPEPNNQKYITVIVGANGTGKTNFVKALLWCLYGDDPHLIEDSHHQSLLNYNVAETLTTETPADVGVSLLLSESQTSMSLHREARFEMNDSREINQMCRDGILSRLEGIYRSNEIEERMQHPEYYVEEKIPKIIMPLFVQDGETLTNTQIFSSGVFWDVVREATELNLLEDIIQGIRYAKSTFTVSSMYRPATARYRQLCIESLNAIESFSKEAEKRLLNDLNNRFLESILPQLGIDYVQSAEIEMDGKIRLFQNGDEFGLEILSHGARVPFIFGLFLSAISVFENKMPFVLDSPFGRLDSKRKAALLNLFSKEMRGSQIILLLTDSEYTSEIRDNLKSVVNAEYELVFDDVYGSVFRPFK